jgi:hypothetical protein
MKIYGGPCHGQETIGDLREAIGYLLGVHTRFDGDHLTVIDGARPEQDPENRRLYQEAWEMLRNARTYSILPPEAQIVPGRWLLDRPVLRLG